jgi:hypothetical protein
MALVSGCDDGEVKVLQEETQAGFLVRLSRPIILNLDQLCGMQCNHAAQRRHFITAYGCLNFQPVKLHLF